MYLKRFFLAINVMIMSTSLATPNVVLHKIQQAHMDVISCHSTFSKNAFTAAILSIKQAMLVGTGAGAYAGMVAGALAGGLLIDWDSNEIFSEAPDDYIVRKAIGTIVSAMGGTIIGASTGAISGFFGTPFYYTFWKKYFERQITEKFFNVLESTSSELRQETFDYLKTQPERAVAEKYFAGDIKALAIFKALLEDSLA
jgi:hypothetical protein